MLNKHVSFKRCVTIKSATKCVVGLIYVGLQCACIKSQPVFFLGGGAKGGCEGKYGRSTVDLGHGGRTHVICNVIMRPAFFSIA